MIIWISKFLSYNRRNLNTDAKSFAFAEEVNVLSGDIQEKREEHNLETAHTRFKEFTVLVLSVPYFGVICTAPHMHRKHLYPTLFPGVYQRGLPETQQEEWWDEKESQ
jgi:hypothetical protein